MTHPRERVQLHFAHQQVREFLASDTIPYPEYDEARTLSARGGKIFYFGTNNEVQEMPDPLTYPIPATTMKTMDVIRAVIAKYTPDEDMQNAADIIQQRQQTENPFETPKEYDPLREKMENEEAEQNNKRIEAAQTLSAALTAIEAFAEERRLGSPPPKNVLEPAIEAASFLAEDILVTSVSDRTAMQRLFQTSVRMQRLTSDKSDVPLDNVPPLTEWHNLLHQARYFEAASIVDSSAVTRFSQQVLKTLLQVSGPDSQEMGGGDKSPSFP